MAATREDVIELYERKAAVRAVFTPIITHNDMPTDLLCDYLDASRMGEEVGIVSMSLEDKVMILTRQVTLMEEYLERARDLGLVKESA